MEVATLVLDDVPEGVWSAFQEQRRRARIASRAHRDHVERWARARRLGAPTSLRAIDDELVRGEAFRLRAEHVAVLESLGAAALARAAREVSTHDFVLLLADSEGVVVRSEGGGGFRRDAERVCLVEGAQWSETLRGTNAIGTALAERRPTVVLGRAHFARTYHGLACYGAPVLDPHGRVVGVLDATGDARSATDEVGRAVFAAATALGELLRLEAYASAGGSVLRVLTRTMDRAQEPMLLVEAGGRVAKLNGPARLALGDSGGRTSRGVLGVDWRALVDEARSPSTHGLLVERPSDGSTRAFRLHAEPLTGLDAEPFAVLVRLEAIRTRSLRSASGPPAIDETDRVRPTGHETARVGRREGERALGRAEASSASPTDAFHRVHAIDPRLLDTIAWARTLAASELPVMLLAETGSGKELFAEAIHAASPRATGPFVAVNCGALTPSLLESELFGYAPGAFTGAERGGRHGLLHRATGGTLFLDEVAEMPLAMQVALLRVLDRGTYQRVGDARTEHADVRLVCATCRDLEAAIASGSFRADLYFRLKGATLRLPPLRERLDLPSLVEHLLRRRATRAGWLRPPEVTDAAMARLRAHAWPGNVRELVAVLDVALVAARALGATVLDVAHLPRELEDANVSEATGTLERAEDRALREALARHAGNVSAAARELGVARSTVYRLARRLGIALG